MPQKLTAYAFRSGEIGISNHVPDGALPIARDYSKRLREAVEVMAVHGYDGETLRVPGLSTTKDDDEALDKFMDFNRDVQRILDDR